MTALKETVSDLTVLMADQVGRQETRDEFAVVERTEVKESLKEISKAMVQFTAQSAVNESRYLAISERQINVEERQTISEKDIGNLKIESVAAHKDIAALKQNITAKWETAALIVGTFILAVGGLMVTLDKFGLIATP